jgi:hypothetical protein
MSHELRTPLNAIIGFGDLLHRGVVPAESDKHREYLGHISSSGRHLLQLINDVLDLAKVEAGKLEFFPEQVLLPKTVQEVQDVLQPQLQRKQLQFITDLDPALGALLLDPARLKQALFNYISNAIKFTPEGGRITVRARAEQPRHVRIEVEDTGIGIAAADLPRLFSEFQQLDAGYSKHHQGTGLGLALVRRLAQAQGGSVGVRSELGVGSVFWLVLPCSPAMVSPPSGSWPSSPTHGCSSAGRWSGGRWLCRRRGCRRVAGPAPCARPRLRGHHARSACARRGRAGLAGSDPDRPQQRSACARTEPCALRRSIRRHGLTKDPAWRPSRWPMC